MFFFLYEYFCLCILNNFLQAKTTLSEQDYSVFTHFPIYNIHVVFEILNLITKSAVNPIGI